MDEIKPDAETAFFIVKELDGSWKAMTDIPEAFTIQREAFRHDVKTGCREIYELLAEDDLANSISSKILESNTPDSQRTAQAIRHALADREIL
jgi:predicted RNase H-related nuclease YkuK (DUF458 family)